MQIADCTLAVTSIGYLMKVCNEHSLPEKHADLKCSCISDCRHKRAKRQHAEISALQIANTYQACWLYLQNINSYWSAKIDDISL
jgi:hypothetical protein